MMKNLRPSQYDENFKFSKSACLLEGSLQCCQFTQTTRKDEHMSLVFLLMSYGYVTQLKEPKILRASSKELNTL